MTEAKRLRTLEDANAKLKKLLAEAMLDFVSDAFGRGRRCRIPCVVDDFMRECLALVPDTSLSGARVARETDACATSA